VAVPKGMITEKNPGDNYQAHCRYLVQTIANLHAPALIIAGFLFFLAFVKATKIYQDIVSLKSPFLVGFFLAG
jgi:hypothetical protein